MTPYLARARAYMKLNNYNLAERDVCCALAMEPNNAKAHQQLGNVNYAKGNLVAALAAFNRAIELNGAPEHYLDRAALYIKEGKHTEAKADCYKAAQQPLNVYQKSFLDQIMQRVTEQVMSEVTRRKKALQDLQKSGLTFHQPAQDITTPVPEPAHKSEP